MLLTSVPCNQGLIDLDWLMWLNRAKIARQTASVHLASRNCHDNDDHDDHDNCHDNDDDNGHDNDSM